MSKIGNFLSYKELFMSSGYLFYPRGYYLLHPVRGDISRETNGPNIRAMVSLWILISLGTFSVWQTD